MNTTRTKDRRDQRWLATSHSPTSRGGRSGRHEHLIHTHAGARRGLWTPGRLGREPRYFTVAVDRRKAVYLIGFHIWNNSHDAMGSGAVTFDRSMVASFRAPAEPSGPTVLYLRRVG